MVDIERVRTQLGHVNMNDVPLHDQHCNHLAAHHHQTWFTRIRINSDTDARISLIAHQQITFPKRRAKKCFFFPTFPDKSKHAITRERNEGRIAKYSKLSR